MAVLHHIALRVLDLDAALQFYQHWFGLICVRDQRPRSVWLSLDPRSVLMLERRGQGEPGPSSGSLELLAFATSVEQRASQRAALIAQGMLEAETEHTLYFRDPEGRRVALSSYPL